MDGYKFSKRAESELSLKGWQESNKWRSERDVVHVIKTVILNVEVGICMVRKIAIHNTIIGCRFNRRSTYNLLMFPQVLIPGLSSFLLQTQMIFCVFVRY